MVKAQFNTEAQVNSDRKTKWNQNVVYLLFSNKTYKDQT